MTPHEIFVAFRTARTQLDIKQAHVHILGGMLTNPDLFTNTVAANLEIYAGIMHKAVACRTHKGLVRLEQAFVKLYDTGDRSMEWNIDNLLSTIRMERFHETSVGRVFGVMSKLTPTQMLGSVKQNSITTFR